MLYMATSSTLCTNKWLVNLCSSPATVTTEAIKMSCPNSTPMLKNSSAVVMAFCGNPISANAPAKPKP